MLLDHESVLHQPTGSTRELGTPDASVLMTNLGNNLHKIEYHMPTFMVGSSVVVQKWRLFFETAMELLWGATQMVMTFITMFIRRTQD